MILEIVSTVAMGGLLSWTLVEGKGLSEGKKISKIASNSGLSVRDGSGVHTIHLLRKSRREWGVEYVYRIPLGLSFQDFQDKRQRFEDGLNNRDWGIDLGELRKLSLKGDLAAQIKRILDSPRKRKEIVMDYDGCLIIRVYKEPLPDKWCMDEDIMEKCTGWAVCVGIAREGIVFHDFDVLPHMVVAGTTRYGKSVFLKNLVTTLIHNNPNRVKLYLLDLKGGLAFNRFAKCRQVVGVAKDVNESLEMLRKITKEMRDRQKDYLAKGHENIQEANDPRRSFIIIDEAAELSSARIPDKEEHKKRAECEILMGEIARIGGAMGYRLVYATQYPTADVLPRNVKQNAPAKLCYLLDSEAGSRVVLDESGAEKLPFVRGRAIYKTDRKKIVQSPLIENPFIDKTIKPHINIVARKEEEHEPRQRKEDRLDTLIIEDA